MAHPERHRTERTGWFRAAVLGANDGTVSTASPVVGVAAAEAARAHVMSAVGRTRTWRAPWRVNWQ